MKKKLLLGLIFIIVGRINGVSQTFDLDTIHYNGPNAATFVLLRDGYTSSEMTTFISHADAFKTALFNESPFNEYQNYINIFIVKTPSLQSGASHPGTATDVTEPAHPVSTVDNYYNSTFDNNNIHRSLKAQTSIVTNVLSNTYPAYDVALILVNTSFPAGSGNRRLKTATYAAANSNALETALHEIGHGFANLADEYYGSARETFNMTQTSSPAMVRWKNWVGINSVDVYQHAGRSWYRPHQNCKMRYLGRDFCSVCSEAIVEKIHSITPALNSFLPDNSSSIPISASPTEFELDLVEPVPNTLKIDWVLNGVTIHKNVNSLVINASDLQGGQHFSCQYSGYR
jgi:hypothetical protein